MIQSFDITILCIPTSNCLRIIFSFSFWLVPFQQHGFQAQSGPLIVLLGTTYNRVFYWWAQLGSAFELFSSWFIPGDRFLASRLGLAAVRRLVYVAVIWVLHESF